MPIFDLFSKRQKKLRGEVVDVYFYDKLPYALRVQIVHIIRDTIGTDISYSRNPFNPYKHIHEALCREYGIFNLNEKRYDATDEECVLNFFLKTEEIEKAIDVIELTVRYITEIIGKNDNYYYTYWQVKMNPENAVSELNYRLREQGFGYQFENGEIIRVDSTYIHSEIVKPTINLLNKAQFSGANEEYLKAHEHFRHGRNKECLTECLKAFESAMKIICTEKKMDF